MSLPSPYLSVPSLSGDQAYFQGITLGAGTPAQFTKVEGLGKPKLRSQNTARPRTRGSFVGLNLLDTRVPTFTMDIGPPFGSYTSLAGFLAAMRLASSTEGAVEYPLWIQMPNFPLLCCMARVIGWDPPWDVSADLGSLMTNVPLQFEATDPYLYSAPTTVTTLSLPTPGVGFTFPMTFPLAFGGGSGGNQATIVNSGDVPCYPMMVVNGPCVNPSITNLSVSGSPTISLNISLNVGDVLMVDCDMQSITYAPSGQSAGPAPNVEMAGSTFFALLPGSNTISFNSQDVAPASGTLAVWSASAYDGIL